MSGGDGKGHNSGAHDSGGSINGTSGGQFGDRKFLYVKHII